MKFIDDDCVLTEKTGVGLGNFDGLHIGHMALISRLIKECDKRNISSMIYTFKEHTSNVLGNRKKAQQILTMDKKTELLSKTKTDYLFLEEFSKEYSEISPEVFVKSILKEKLNTELVIVGFNYTFGKNGAGDAETLKKLGKDNDIEVIIVPPIKIGDEIVSSTLVRKFVIYGMMEKFHLCTGRLYSIYGTVEMGRQIGTSLGFPTANIIPEEYLILPKAGVYVTQTVLDGIMYNSITNIGRNPTFGELNKVSCETHIFGREGNLYGKRIEVYFMAKLREERKFESKEQLCDQINMDITAASEFFNANVKGV